MESFNILYFKCYLDEEIFSVIIVQSEATWQHGTTKPLQKFTTMIICMQALYSPAESSLWILHFMVQNLWWWVLRQVLYFTWSCCLTRDYSQIADGASHAGRDSGHWLTSMGQFVVTWLTQWPWKEGPLDSARCECKYWVESLVVVNVEIMTNCLQLLNNLQIAVSWTGVSQPLALKGSNWV